jgi:hypothetical protein
MRRLALCVSVAAVLAIARVAAAESSAVEDSDRELGGHIFVPSRLVQSPFSVTSFGTTTILGKGTTTGTRLDLEGNAIGTREFDLVGFGQGFDFTGRINPSLAARIDVLANVYSGIDGPSLIVAGSTAVISGGAGLTLAKNFGRTLRAGVTFDARWQPEYSVLIGSAIVRAIQTRQVDEDAVLADAKRVRFEPGVSIAWAPTRYLGFVGNFSVVYARRVSSESRSKEDTGTAFGISGDLDLNPLWGMPFAVTGVYRWEGGGGLNLVQDLGGGVWYSRRVNLQLGVEAVRRSTPLRQEEGAIARLDLDATLGSLVLRYFW